MERLDYITAFTFFLNDRAWFRKFLTASLLTFTLVGITPVLGWTIELTRRVSCSEHVELPEWRDLASLWKTGFKYWLLNLAWLSPVILSLLSLYLPLLFASRLDDLQLLAILSAGLACDLLFITLYSVPVLFLLPAAMGILAGSGSLAKAIDPRRAWRAARAHFSLHLTVFLIVGLGLLTVITFLAPLTLFLGLPPMLVYSGMVAAHFAGQLVRLGDSDKDERTESAQA